MIILCPTSNKTSMNIQKTNHPEAVSGYVSPAMDMQEFYTEGVLCTSGNNTTENLDENEGIW